MNSSAQNTECVEFEFKLIQFMENQINRRSKAVVICVNECVNTLITLYASRNIEWIHKYSISKNIYDAMIEKGQQFIHRKCKKGIDSDRIINTKSTTWHRLQNYWLHNAPEVSTDFYIMILTEIAEYFNYISSKMDEICIGINQDEIRQFLKKKFVLNLLTAPLQQHPQSNAKGPIIQYAAWKQVKIQETISKHFDYSYNDKWDEWMQLNQKNGSLKGMRIDNIINKRVKKFARESLREFVERLEIEIEIKDFEIRQEEIEEFELFSTLNIMNEEDNIQFDPFHFNMDTVSTFSSNNDLFSGYDHQYRYDQYPSFQSVSYNNSSPLISTPSYNDEILSMPLNAENSKILYQDTNNRNNRNNTNYGPFRGTRNTVKSLRNSPMECAQNERIKFLQKENNKLLNELNHLHQLLHRVNNQCVALNTFSRNYSVSNPTDYNNNDNNIDSKQQFNDKWSNFESYPMMQSNTNDRIHEISLSPNCIQRTPISAESDDNNNNNNNNNYYQQHNRCCFNDEFVSNVGRTFHEINHDQQAINQNNFVYN